MGVHGDPFLEDLGILPLFSEKSHQESPICNFKGTHRQRKSASARPGNASRSEKTSLRSGMLWTNIERRLIKPRRLRTNGMVERFTGGFKEVPDQTRFESSRQLKETLMRYLRIYNQHIPQKNLGHIISVETLKKWRKTHPDLFKSACLK